MTIETKWVDANGKPLDGGRAFPSLGGPDYVKEPGMSLRDWFAGQAISALVARHRADVAWSELAPTAYRIADAMLAARSGK